MRTEQVCELLREVAADVVRPRFRALAEDEIDQKRPGDLVTVADREAEAVITRALKLDEPGVLVVGEEATFADPALLDALPTAQHAWVVDPVDGTRNFVNGRKEYAVMMAEVRSGIPVRAFILQPELDRMYVAERGGGLWRDDERLHPIPRSKPYGGAASRRRFIGKGGEGVKPVRPSAWCCGFDYTHLLEGMTDFTIYRHGSPWDHLPGLLMLHEVGGTVRTPDGKQIRAGANGPGLLAVANEQVWQTVAPLWLELADFDAEDRR